MQGIALKNGLISYYGNLAGYTEKDAAVVDRIFENEELTSWLQSHSLTPKWTDGVMERLMAGEQPGAVEATDPLKNVRIWQLKPETDVYMKFISLDEMTKGFGAPTPEHYRIAFDGQLGTNVALDCQSINNHPLNTANFNLTIIKDIGRFTRPRGYRTKAWADDHLQLIRLR